jgi:hypothetical protein
VIPAIPRMSVSIPRMSASAVAAVAALEQCILQCEQHPITTHHLLHAGMYARTITIPAGVVLTGALIKRATVLIVNGDTTVATGEDSIRITGYCVLPASAGRKQAFVAHADTQLTMLFPTQATDVRAAEEEFTDEADRLFSRRGENVITITEEL